MAKRLTDSEKWEDPWFMELSNEDRLLWIYILDKCDHAGIWKVNKPLTEFVLRFKIDWQGFLSKCGNRIIVLKDKWHVPKFISFQYGVLNPECRPHRPVIEILNKMNLKGYQYPIDTDKEQEQEKDKDQEKDNIAFEDFWKLYPSRNGKKLLKKDALKQFSKLDEATYPEIIQATKNYAKSGQMPRDAVRFLKDDYWREWITPAPVAEKFSVKTEMPDRTTQPRWDYPPEVQALVKSAIPRGGK